MVRAQLSKKILETIVDREIAEMKEDPARATRKLVDMGCQLSTGRFQKAFFEVSQRMLENPDSAYYTLIARAVEQVDLEHLKAFGINLGWESWTVGAETIRRQEAERGYEIPWTMNFCYAGETHGMTLSCIDAWVREGKELGIHSFLLTCEEGAEAGLGQICERMRRYPDCVFFLRLRAGQVEPFLKEEPVLHAAVLLDTEEPGWQEAAKQLREEKRVYGFWQSFGEPDSDLLDAWVETCCEAGGLLAVCQTAEGSDRSDELYRYTVQRRKEQKYPIFLMECRNDAEYVDQIISGKTCLLEVSSEGRIHGWLEKHPESCEKTAAEIGLKELLHMWHESGL